MTKDKSKAATALYSAKLVLEYLDTPSFIQLHGETPAKHQRNVIQAVNEHAALNAAADANHNMLGMLTYLEKIMIWPVEYRQKIDATITASEKADTALASVRAGNGGDK